MIMIRGGFPINSILFMFVLASWVYRTGVFLLVCVLFRLTCELQILRLQGVNKLFETSNGSGSDAIVIFNEHLRIRKQLWVTSHRYRFFIIVCLFIITVSQFVALLLVLTSKTDKNFFNSGDIVVRSNFYLDELLNREFRDQYKASLLCSLNFHEKKIIIVIEHLLNFTGNS